MVRSGLDVHCCRSRLGVAYGWHLLDGQHMRSSWQPGAIASALYDAPDRTPINLEIESQIPSEVRRPVHDQLTRREVMIRTEVTGTSLRDSADKNRAHRSKNRKNDAGKAVSWFHGTHCTYELDFRQQIAAEFVINLSEDSEKCHVACRRVRGVERQDVHSAWLNLQFECTGATEEKLCARSKSVTILLRFTDCEPEQHQQKPILARTTTAARTGVEKTGLAKLPRQKSFFELHWIVSWARLLCLNVLKRRCNITTPELQRLIELGILTPDCDRSSATRKLSPELRREASRWVKQSEAMSGLLLARILQRVKTAD